MVRIEKKKRRNRTLANSQRNQARIKGKIFELVLRELLSKAGFSTDVDSRQITRNQKRLHGRGSTYDPDFFGQFRMGIPFVHPIMIVAEAKYFNSKVHLGKVREFLGAYIDFSQYARVNTMVSGDERYSVLYSTRFTYCPIFFSVKGFDKSAQGLMYAHGINYISYENSDIVNRIFKLIEGLLKTINFSKFKSKDFKVFDELRTINQLGTELKKNNFDNALNKLQKYLSNVNSLIGVIDLKYPVNILHNRKIAASKLKKIRIKRLTNEHFFIENTAGRKYGEFSLSGNFFNGYVSYAKKNNLSDKIFTQIDIVFPHKENLEIKQLLIDPDSRNKLLEGCT